MKKIREIYKKYREIINYIIVGGCTTVVSIASKYLLLFTILKADDGFQLQLSVIISWICAVSFAYIANRVFVFNSKDKNIFKEIVSFVSSRIVTLLLEMFIMWLFITAFGLDTNLWVAVITILCQVIIMVLNYVFSKIVVFRKKA